MAIIKPFKAIRPTSDMAGKIAELPYDVYNRDEAYVIAKDNPYSFLHVDKAEIDFPNGFDQYSDEVYNKAKENLQKLIDDRNLVKDETDNLYIYTLDWQGKSHTGLVATTSVDDYNNGVIKKHELTRQDKEIDRIKHIRTLNANTGPIFLTYKKKNEIDSIIEDFKKNNAPTYEIDERDGVSQKVWVLSDKDIIKNLTSLFSDVETLYIADGHHRNAAAVAVANERRNNGESDTAEFNYYLSVIFPDDQLNVLDYNRVIKDLNGLSVDDFLEKLSDKFSVEVADDLYKPTKKGEFSMYLGDKWYKLNIKPEFVPNDVIESLDCSILQNYVFDIILDIKDPRTDKRIDFVGGIRGLEELKRRVDSKEMAVAFALFRTSVLELMNVADDNKIMPPKSTWFEPKLRSGLFIHDLE